MFAELLVKMDMQADSNMARTSFLLASGLFFRTVTTQMKAIHITGN